MYLTHQRVERPVSRLKIGGCDIGQLKAVVFVLSANHVDLAFTQRTLSVEENLEFALVGGH